MWVMSILSLLGIVVQLSLIIVSIASGLYYVAEIVEENTEAAKKYIRWLSLTVLTIYIGLAIFEDIPMSMILCGILSQVMHLVILNDFPYISVGSLSFVAVLILFVLNHYLAFYHFATAIIQFYELLGFFTVCIWLVPFALFISLSANDNILPAVFSGPEADARFQEMNTDALGNYLSKKKNRNGVLSFLDNVKERLFPRNKKMF